MATSRHDVAKQCKQSGASIVELIIVLPFLASLGLGAIQVGQVYSAKNTLNYAAFEAARTGSINHAQSEGMRKAMARAMTPLYGDTRTAGKLTTSYGRALVDAKNVSFTKLEILSPTQESFDDHGYNDSAP